MRIGIGYDIHRFQEGRPLVLGGLPFPGEAGLAGHSDADVLLHAITDAILGAAGLGDMGKHFPPDDAAFKDADSRQLLLNAVKMTNERGLSVEWVDATIITEKPRLAGHLEEIRGSVVRTLGGVGVNVKAKSNEGVGEVGHGLAMAAMAVALLRETEGS